MKRARFKRASALLMAVMMVMTSSGPVMAAETAAASAVLPGTEEQPAQGDGQEKQEGPQAEPAVSQDGQEPLSPEENPAGTGEAETGQTAETNQGQTEGTTAAEEPGQGKEAAGAAEAGQPETATITPDGATGTSDAATGAPETAAGTPDGAAGTPEIATGTPDAATGTPEAAAGTPNAMAGNMEATTAAPNATAGTPGAADTLPDSQTNTGAQAGEASAHTDASKKTAGKSGELSVVIEHSSDGNATDGLTVEPIKVSYAPGETILDAVNQIDGVSFSESFGENLEETRLIFQDEEYVAAADTVAGAVTLSETVCPEEVTMVRIHQNTANAELMGYFPAELQQLIAAMTEYQEFAAEQEPGDAAEAYGAAVSAYAQAAASPETAQKLADDLYTAMETEKTAGGEAAENDAGASENGTDKEDAAGADASNGGTQSQEESEGPAPENGGAANGGQINGNSTDEKSAVQGSAEKNANAADKQIAGKPSVQSKKPVAARNKEEQATYAVTFHITYDGAPVEGAKITVRGTDASSEITSDKYSFNLKADYYTYEISADGYETGKGNFKVTEGQQGTQTIEVTLVPSRDLKYPVQFKLSCGGSTVTDALISVTDQYSGRTVKPTSEDKYSYQLPLGTYTYKIYLNEEYSKGKFRPFYETVEGSFKVEKQEEPKIIEEELKRLEYPIINLYFGDTPGVSTNNKRYGEWSNEVGVSQELTYEACKDLTLTIPDYDFTGLSVAPSGGPGSDVSCTVEYTRKSNGQPATVQTDRGSSFSYYYALNDCIAIGKGGNEITLTAKSDTQEQV